MLYHWEKMHKQKEILEESKDGLTLALQVGEHQNVNHGKPYWLQPEISATVKNGMHPVEQGIMLNDYSLGLVDRGILKRISQAAWPVAPYLVRNAK